ncbi:MAG: hypothetical protein FJX22_01990 [Alphaproteobacteria bacterium]|nr:hypothetical protein [Alphaproteobacteria bacterium]
MVEVEQAIYILAMAELAKTYSAAVLTNGYFDLSPDQEKRRNQATLWFPSAVAFGMKNVDGSRKPDTFAVLSINSNASVAKGPSETCNYDATVRAGYVVAQTNSLRDKPIVQAVVVYNNNTACNALAAQVKLLEHVGIQIAGYSKGANYAPKDGEFTLEHAYTKEQRIPWIVSPIVGTANPTYPQTGDRSELEAALAGVNYDSLRFLVTKELYDQVRAAQR